MTHKCFSKLISIGSDNGLSPEWRQANIWTNTGILFIRPIGTNFNEISIEIHRFSFKKIHLKMSSGKWSPFCLDSNELDTQITYPVCFKNMNLSPWPECMQIYTCVCVTMSVYAVVVWRSLMEEQCLHWTIFLTSIIYISNEKIKVKRSEQGQLCGAVFDLAQIFAYLTL